MTCIDICRTNEQSSKQVKTLQSAEDEIAKISIKPNKRPTDIRPAWKTKNVDKPCMYCGRQHARKKELCPAWGKQCNSCGTLNHFASECKKSRQQRRVKRGQPVNTVDECSEQSTDSDDIFCIENIDNLTDSHHSSHRNIRNKIFAQIEINRKM